MYRHAYVYLCILHTHVPTHTHMHACTLDGKIRCIPTESKFAHYLHYNLTFSWKYWPMNLDKRKQSEA